MRLRHPGHPARLVRLGYCLNAVPAETAADVEHALDHVAVPLARRFGSPDGFGVGLYLPARAALELALPGGGADRFARGVVDRGLDPFTFNAFPFGGFHRAGLKRGVFAPPWHDPARREYTLAVASVAERIARLRGSPRAHLSISTHGGGFGPAGRAGAAEALAATALLLEELEEASGVRVVLGVEPEPRSAANDSADFARLASACRGGGLERAALALGRSPDEALGALERHLGLCLDTCHAAVEFEQPAEVLAHLQGSRLPLAKLQLSSALSVSEPGRNPKAVARLLSLSEPVYLHQTTAQRFDGTLLRADDLDEVEQRVRAGDRDWLGAREWRCHFHVPLGPAGGFADGLSSTYGHGQRMLSAVLSDPSSWGSEELHVEVETYTFHVLPPELRGGGQLVDALERELRVALADLAAAGWHPSPSDGQRSPEKSGPASG